METAFIEYVAKARRCGPFTFDFLIADEIGHSWYGASPEQQMPERNWCLERVKPGATVLDCGAHHGMMTVLFALAAGSDGRVISFEALPENAAIVRRNAALNGLANVDVRPKALGAGPAERPYHHNFGNANIFGAVSDGPPTGTIKLVALDDEIPATLRVDFVKMDVEGSDLEALRGARRVLEQRPLLDLELHNFLFADRMAVLTEIFDILGRCNYTYEVLIEPFHTVQDFDAARLDWLAEAYNPHIFCTPR